MEQLDIHHKFFSRTEEWDWLKCDMIHVFDSKRPRIITMDPWPQRIYLDADGQLTVDAYIKSLHTTYPRGTAPAGLAETVIQEVRTLANVEGIIALTDEPVELPMNIRDPRTPSSPVDMRGTWQGSYEYDHPPLTAVDFTMVIDDVQGSRFSGTVKDHEETGGTPGVGRISGKVVDAGVVFTKQMPIYCGRDKKMQRIVDPNKKHPKLFYSGEFAPSNRVLYGTWRFKYGWMWRGWFPDRVSYGNGRWSMRKVDEGDASSTLARVSSPQLS